jgi:peptidoglycan/xylan/chitin deacetylase (PgdA/CDA1 family)
MPMFFHVDICGDRLPERTLCLTYDDGPGQVQGNGPGPRTLELAEYLFERGVPATFFFIGKHLEPYPQLPGWLSQMGHLVGNHTATHPGLVALAVGGGNVCDELSRADARIRSSVSQPITYLRAPYGNWRELVGVDRRADKPMSIVASQLNRRTLSKNYVGPINWDISGHDYDYWREGKPAEECASEYLARIDQVGRGIVLLHDSSDEESTRSRNQTFALTRLLVPVLEGLGYTFVRLDAIPQVQSAARVSKQVALRTSSGHYLATSVQEELLTVNRTVIGFREQFGVVEEEAGQIGLRACNGCYLSLDPARRMMVGGARSMGQRERLNRTVLEEGRILLQAADGSYLTADRASGEILARASRSAAEVFLEVDLFDPLPFSPASPRFA